MIRSRKLNLEIIQLDHIEYVSLFLFISAAELSSFSDRLIGQFSKTGTSVNYTTRVQKRKASHRPVCYFKCCSVFFFFISFLKVFGRIHQRSSSNLQINAPFAGSPGDPACGRICSDLAILKTTWSLFYYYSVFSGHSRLFQMAESPLWNNSVFVFVVSVQSVPAPELELSGSLPGRRCILFVSGKPDNGPASAA